MPLKISELYIYPIKSMGGISLTKAKVSKAGFEYDRYWMLTDDKGKFITQREDPRLALFGMEIDQHYLKVSFGEDQIKIPLTVQHEAQTLKTKVWSDEVLSQVESDEVNRWFSAMLGYETLLLRPAKEFSRGVRFNPEDDLHFADAGQYLFLGQSSLDHLNEKLDHRIGMDRFRPNVVFKGGSEHIEDSWDQIRIGNVFFKVTEPCGRCKMTTVDQQTAEVSAEPLKTMSRYRLMDQQICFGQYLKSTTGVGEYISVDNQIFMV